MTQSSVPCCLILYTKVQIPVTLKVHKPIKLLTKKLLFDVNNFFLQSHKPGHILIVNTWAIYPAVLVYVQIRFSFHITYNEEFMLYCKKRPFGKAYLEINNNRYLALKSRYKSNQKENLSNGTRSLRSRYLQNCSNLNYQLP